MHAATPARGNARLWIATFVLMLAAAPVGAQCVITGPSALCNGSAELCGPTGDYAYTWSGPNGFLETTPCVTVTAPGTYTLSLIDMGAGRFLGMCSRSVAAGSALPAATIEGPGTACEGESVMLCGPDLGVGFQWTGPGVTATTRCVTATGPGVWTLSLVDLASGCTGPAATHELVPGICVSFTACPRPVVFWAGGCRSPEKFRYTREELAGFAACASDRSALFAWSSPFEDFCATLNARGTLRGRALRQMAAVWMNVCSWESRVAPARGAPAGVDPSTTFESASGAMSVSSWIASAESELASLEGQNEQRKAVRDAYRSLIRQAWKLNHGEGLDAPCERGGRFSSDPMRLMPTVEESLDSEMMWELEQPGVALERPAPNPMVQSSTVAFTVFGSSQQVTVSVLDLAGRRVAQVTSGTFAPGRHTATWNGRGEDGQSVRPGVYFVRVRGEQSENRTTITVVR